MTRTRAGAPGIPEAEAMVALHDVAEGTTLSEAQVTEAVETAVADTYRRLIEDDPLVRARVDPAGRAWRLYRVADGVETEVEVANADFARQAAAAARAAVAARLHEASRSHVLSEAASRRGQLIDAVVERADAEACFVDAAGVPGVLPLEERIPGEHLRVHQHLKVIVVEGRRRGPDALLVVSRTHPLLVQRLMEQEVPELQSGQVVIRAIAREPGRRTKVAVDAPAGDLDPQGACIGPKGVRQRAVTSELGDEQVQIVAWSSDPATYVANTLIPATVSGVTLDPATQTAHVTVPADQLSLAIGRAGENARLAARLTGWRIDIRAPEE